MPRLRGWGRGAGVRGGGVGGGGKGRGERRTCSRRCWAISKHVPGYGSSARAVWHVVEPSISIVTFVTNEAALAFDGGGFVWMASSPKGGVSVEVGGSSTRGACTSRTGGAAKPPACRAAAAASFVPHAFVSASFDAAAFVTSAAAPAIVTLYSSTSEPAKQYECTVASSLASSSSVLTIAPSTPCRKLGVHDSMSAAKVSEPRMTSGGPTTFGRGGGGGDGDGGGGEDGGGGGGDGGDGGVGGDGGDGSSPGGGFTAPHWLWQNPSHPWLRAAWQRSGWTRAKSESARAASVGPSFSPHDLGE